jgi:diguanylate cyclase (GGDEF)-like protein
MPAPSSVPARRRTDAARKPPAAAPEHAEPLLKAHRDTLTGLSTAEHLSDTAAPWQRDLTARGLALCVLRLGVDGFESVCQRYGSAAGDEVLIQIAKRLRHLARDEDRVLRLEAAEFMLLLSCPLEEATAFSQAVAARVVVEVQRPLAYRTVSHLPIGCSVGSALWPANGSSLNDVLAHADEALAAARHSGRGQARQYAGAPEPAPA